MQKLLNKVSKVVIRRHLRANDTCDNETEFLLNCDRKEHVRKVRLFFIV